MKKGATPRRPVLIRFDRKTLGFLGLLLLLLAAGTALKLHGSSIGLWNRNLPDRDPRAGILLGTAKLIRIDEWVFITPAILSQARSRPPFPAANLSWGAERVPLIANFPVRHWSALARPQYWGLLVLDLERGFSFYWNMKWFLLVSGLFLLLMLLTRNDFGVSLLGSGWLYFSGFMQWWFSTPAMLPEMVGCVAWLLVALHYVFLSSRRWAVAIAALVFSIALLDAVVMFYPPFQVPLLYLGIATLIGSIGTRLAAGEALDRLGFRAACAGVALAGVGAFLALYYREAKPTIDLMLGTVYPASRTSSGGEVSFAQVFSGFYGPFMSERSFPHGWFNVCEASNFVLLFPVPMAALLWLAWRRRSVTILEWSLMAYLLIILAWLTVGFPGPLAVASGFGLSQGTRSLLGLGLASVILCCVFLARRRAVLAQGLGVRLIAALVLLGALAGHAAAFHHATGGFASGDQTAIVFLLAGTAGLLLLTLRRTLFAICVLVPSVASFGLVNPVAVGLGPILDTRLFREVSRIVAREPDARWAVYGSPILADLSKAAGARVFNGTKFVPPLDDFRVIDPESSADSTYNRFAHVALIPREGPDVDFEFVSGDFYRVLIDPTSDLWRRLGVRYAVLPFEVTGGDFLNQTSLVQALPDHGLWIYRYRWGEPSARGD